MIKYLKELKNSLGTKLTLTHAESSIKSGKEYLNLEDSDGKTYVIVGHVYELDAFLNLTESDLRKKRFKIGLTPLWIEMLDAVNNGQITLKEAEKRLDTNRVTLYRKRKEYNTLRHIRKEDLTFLD